MLAERTVSFAAKMAVEPAEEDIDRPASKAMDKKQAKDMTWAFASSPEVAADQQDGARLHIGRAAKVSSVQKGDRGDANAVTRDGADGSSSGLLLVGGNCCWIGRIPP
jgi:hypothetical protein